MYNYFCHLDLSLSFNFIKSVHSYFNVIYDSVPRKNNSSHSHSVAISVES